MKTHKPRARQRSAQSLPTSLADRLNPGAMSTPICRNTPAQMPRFPTPSRSTRDVLTLLTAATGMALAAQPDCTVELLPGLPTTILVVSGGKAKAAFVLPVAHEEACLALGRVAPPQVDLVMDWLWEEERQDDMLPLDLLLDTAEAEQVA